MNLTEYISSDKHHWWVYKKGNLSEYTLYTRFTYSAFESVCLNKVTRIFHLSLN